MLSEYNKRVVEFRVFIVTIIMVFALISFISTLIQFINTNIKEFTIHLLCGGTIKSIIQRIIIQVFSIILFAYIIIIAIQGIDLVALLTFGSSLLIGIIILIYPLILLSKKQINTILKRSE